MFNTKLSEIYPESKTQVLWHGGIVSVAREVRNCIVHNGGHVSDKARQMNEFLDVYDGNVIVKADDARTLYESLKPLVLKIIKGVLK